VNLDPRAVGMILAGLLAACSTPTPPEVAPQAAAHASTPAVPPVAANAPAPSPAHTIESYKQDFARRVAHSSPAVFHDPLPKMLKSVVVVEVTINRDGRLTHASIRRSNGYKNLETAALHAVHQAAPFPAPSRAIRRSDGSVNFLETFLFRDDGRFQIRTLAEAQ
jgi:protein TonB